MDTVAAARNPKMGHGSQHNHLPVLSDEARIGEIIPFIVKRQTFHPDLPVRFVQYRDEQLAGFSGDRRLSHSKQQDGLISAAGNPGIESAEHFEIRTGRLDVTCCNNRIMQTAYFYHTISSFNS